MCSILPRNLSSIWLLQLPKGSWLEEEEAEEVARQLCLTCHFFWRFFYFFFGNPFLQFFSFPPFLPIFLEEFWGFWIFFWKKDFSDFMRNFRDLSYFFKFWKLRKKFSKFLKIFRKIQFFFWKLDNFWNFNFFFQFSETFNSSEKYLNPKNYQWDAFVITNLEKFWKNSKKNFFSSNIFFFILRISVFQVEFISGNLI